MNIFKSVESFLERVDEAAAKSLRQELEDEENFDIEDENDILKNTQAKTTDFSPTEETTERKDSEPTDDQQLPLSPDNLFESTDQSSAPNNATEEPTGEENKQTKTKGSEAAAMRQEDDLLLKQKYEDLLKKLKKENRKLLVQNQAQQREQDALTKELHTLQSRCQSTEEKVKGLQKSVSALEAKNKTLTSELEEKEAINTSLQQQIDQQGEMGKEKEQELVSQKTTILTLTKEKAELEKQNKKYSELLQSKETEVEGKSTAEKETLQGLLSEARDKELSLQSTVLDLSQKLASSLLLLDEKTREEQESARQVKSLQFDLTSLRSEYADYKKRAAKVLQDKETLLRDGQQDRDRDDQLAALHSRLKSLTDQLSVAQDQLSSLGAKNFLLQSSLAEQQSQAEEEQKEFRQQLQRSEAEKEKEKEKVRRLQQDLQSSSDDSTSRIEGYERDLQRVNALLRSKTLELQKIQQMLGTTTPEEVKELSSRLSQMQSQLTSSVAEKSTLNEELVTLRKKTEEQSQEILQLGSQLKEVTTNFASIPVVTDEDDGSEQKEHLPRIRSLKDRSSTSGGTTSSVKKRVAKAASVVDQFSLQIGSVLRRSRNTRLLLVIYAIVLHMFFLLIFLSARYASAPSSPQDLVPQVPQIPVVKLADNLTNNS